MFKKSHQEYSKRSLSQSINTMSNHNNGVFDMIHDEKTAKIDPEKWAAINDPRAPPPPARADEDDRVVVRGMPVRRVEPRLPTPGAYRIGDTESDYGGRTMGGDSDDDSASCLMVVPKAALVDDEQKDGVMKDVEAPSSKIPIVKARSFPDDSLHSSPSTKKKSTHKRKFRCCMILLCLLLASLLGGVLYFLCKDEFSTSTSPLEAADGNRNGNNDRNNDNDNDGRGSGGGGNGDRNGDGGNGRGNNND
mmetsp:Transcript_25152/g.62020  ORF Transcript_25152/g.62020 Transcript_25152/m.62020 type:complete len:249 (-) Transcript_25152:101-847(-)